MNQTNSIVNFAAGLSAISRRSETLGSANNISISLTPVAEALTKVATSIAKPAVPQGINKLASAKEVTCSPCHAVTHGMYSVNSAKIYIQF